MGVIIQQQPYVQVTVLENGVGVGGALEGTHCALVPAALEVILGVWVLGSSRLEWKHHRDTPFGV